MVAMLRGRFNLKQIITPFITLLITIYFIYHIFQGERGVIAFLRLQQKIEASEKTLATLQNERENLERRIYLLRPDSLDTDILEERARFILNFSEPEEVIIQDYGFNNTDSKK